MVLPSTWGHLFISLGFKPRPSLNCGLNVEAWYWSAMMVWEPENPKVMIESVTLAFMSEVPSDLWRLKKLRITKEARQRRTWKSPIIVKMSSIPHRRSKTNGQGLKQSFKGHAFELHDHKSQMQPGQLPGCSRSACLDMIPGPGKKRA